MRSVFATKRLQWRGIGHTAKPEMPKRERSATTSYVTAETVGFKPGLNAKDSGSWNARRNDLPQPKHAERFRPGRPHSRRSLTWLEHAIRHDPDLRDDTAHPQPATHAAARSFMHRMHARAAKRVTKDSVEHEHWREVHG